MEDPSFYSCYSTLCKYNDNFNLTSKYFHINPSTLRVPQESIVCDFHAFENKANSHKIFEGEVVGNILINISPSNIFDKNAFVRKISTK